MKKEGMKAPQCENYNEYRNWFGSTGLKRT
ncbi:hypothetical protein CEXT_218701, partial [Caerostris extrusa]